MADGKNFDAVMLGLSGMVEVVKLVQQLSSGPATSPEEIAAKVMRSEELSRAALQKWKETE